MADSFEIRSLGPDDLHLIGEIDRSETVTGEFTVRNGELVPRPVSLEEVPPWLSGNGPHSVAAVTEFCRPLVEGGARFLGAFEGEVAAGVAVVDAEFETATAWLAFLHISRRFRRRGIASTLWDACIGHAATAGARRMYVSATPTDSAVGFYLSRGCVLVDPPHDDLYRAEPDDIHLICRL